ncbi:MAG: MFS transporter [Candidatus Bathyarchaeota archaeon]|nr:MAG: MFS transporter [Candidatus Bathyarchaeota archaeon]
MFNKIADFFRRQTWNFRILLIHGILVGGGRQGVIHALTGQYTNLYIVALGASKIQLGLIQSLQRATRVFLSVPIGQVIDRISLKKILLLGMMLEFLAPLMYGLAINWYMVIPAALLISTSWPIRGTVRNILLADSLEDTSRATGFSVFSTIGAIPGIFMPFISAFIVESFGGINVAGIRPLFYIQFVFLAPISLLVYWKIKEPKRDRSKKSVSVLESFKKFLVFEKGPRTWILVWVLDSFGMLALFFLTVFAVEVKGATPSILAWMGMASTIAGIVFTIPYGRLADKIGRKPALYFGLIPTFSFIFFLIYCPSPEWLILVGVLQGAWTANFAVWHTITMELVPKQLLGSFSGIQGMVTGVSSVIASLLAGILWETISPYAVFLVALAFETSAILLAIPIPETLKKTRAILK